MVVIKTTSKAMASLQPKHRRVVSTKTRLDLFQQTKRHVVHKLTPEELKKQKERRENKRTLVDTAMAKAMAKVKEAAKDLAKEVGGSEEVWNRKLMQNARIGVTQREPNRWNAFVSKRMEDINASQYMALRGYEYYSYSS